jgi:hypothetical protein
MPKEEARLRAASPGDGLQRVFASSLISLPSSSSSLPGEYVPGPL